MGAADAIRAKLHEKFRATASERIDRVSRAVLQLGTPDWNEESQRASMHELHTLKGEARMMRFGEVSSLAHLGEELVLAQPGKPQTLRDLLLRILDLALAITQGQEVAAADVEDIIERGKSFAGVTRFSEARAPAPGAPIAPRDKPPLAMPRAEPSVRIDVRKLDELTEVSANLMVNQAAIEYAIDDLITTLRGVDDDGAVASIITEIAKIREDVRDNGLRVHSLESQVRDLRLLPLATLFDAYPLAVHDLAREQGKDVRVEVAGTDVEIDKHVFEALGEPLLHLVRNAIDHGIETPRDREQRGKEPTATIVLSAEQRGGWVELEVRDDGKGIAPHDVRATVLRRGLLTETEVATRSDQQILSFLFRPGFSTRTTVTDVSGRGMGLDIVKQRIEALGGSVRIDSEPGAGTAFLMRIPISAVLVRGMVVEAAGAVCAVPADSVAGVLRLEIDKVRCEDGQTVLEVDGECLPLFELAQLLSNDARRQTRIDTDLALVVQAQSGRMAVLVDRFRGEHKLVHRAMDPFCEGLRLYAGTATLDSGELVVLLNVPELLAAGDPHHRAVSARVERQRSVLVVEDSELARTLVVHTLREAGFFVEQAGHGGEALERLRNWRPDVIVSDIDMPEVDGWSLLTQVRRERNLRDVPVVVFSSRAAPQDRERAKALGADAYLVKTQTLESMLVATVARVVSEGGRP
ncbi:MAG: response regulator [Myxococcota bacterium]